MAIHEITDSGGISRERALHLACQRGTVSPGDTIIHHPEGGRPTKVSFVVEPAQAGPEPEPEPVSGTVESNIEIFISKMNRQKLIAYARELGYTDFTVDRDMPIAEVRKNFMASWRAAQQDRALPK